MASKKISTPRREESLSRDRIIEAAIELLDSNGEGGLTFRSLSERLATGPGALYWHVANKDDLLSAACDAIVARTLEDSAVGATPDHTIRTLAGDLFDAIDLHPWVGSSLAAASGQLPMMRIVERIGRQVRALGVPDAAQWATASVLLHYILGVGGQNAANGQFARTHGIDREAFLAAMSARWLALDPEDFAFTRSFADRLPTHDDRADFLAGIDVILDGIASAHGR
ncbi:TetR/AcrR family transcriptional regulator [Variovorax sp. UMC13]|uniref:TetR/AcrR family transcriptional regulator n=1 Tax=Variovorax sp. UMC13 TaxID=1862326 RepID=UPI001602EDBF|nr:TetR/AcrR family transcriptional regulator [Variovorax sp. UMC13]MBB1602035.1 TetR family transcriptional regulator [Variovorax sp. UMC13]